MARTIRDSILDTRAARDRLKGRGKPYFRAIEPGLHLGYRKPRGRKGKPAVAGKWVARHYLGGQSYAVETIGVADDFGDADGVAILSYAQAQKLARKRWSNRKRAAAGKTGPLTVQLAVESYLEFIETRGKSAVDARHRARAHIYPALGDFQVDALTTEQLRNWQMSLAKALPRVRSKAGEQQYRQLNGDDPEAKRRRMSSANRVLTILKAALNHAYDEKKAASNEAWGRRLKRFDQVEAARLRYLTIAEAQRLINAADPEFRPLVIAALQTGARYSELARLRVEDFNPESGTIHVRTSKSGKERHIVLTDEGADFFQQHCLGRKGSEVMFSRASGAAWERCQQDSPMRNACKRAAIDPPVGIHQLRHTWASHAVMNGMPLMVVARNLGHVNINMVQKHYGHLSRSFISDEIRKAAPRFGTVAPSNVTPLRR